MMVACWLVGTVAGTVAVARWRLPNESLRNFIRLRLRRTANSHRRTGGGLPYAAECSQLLQRRYVREHLQTGLQAGGADSNP